MAVFEYLDVCPLCKSIKIKNVGLINYDNDKVLELLKISPKIEVKLAYCSSCSHHFANPQIAIRYLEYYYSVINSEYYKFDQAEKDDLHNEHIKIFKIINKIKTEGNVLDVGCGYGHLLNIFSANNWKRYGIEPSPLAADYGKEKLGINIKQGYLSDNIFDENFFDVILLFDVIEHLKEPNEVIRLLYKYLKNDGILLIGTGDIKSLNAILARTNWAYFGSWEHISFFSLKSLKNLLKQNDLAIFKCYKTSYKGSFFYNIKVFLKNIITLLKITTKAILNIIYPGKFKYQKVQLAFDHMIVIAMKIIKY